MIEEKDMWDALESVSMHEAIAALPDKLDSTLEEEGSLSKGQVRDKLHYEESVLSDDGHSANFSVWLESYCESARSSSSMKLAAGTAGTQMKNRAESNCQL